MPHFNSNPEKPYKFRDEDFELAFRHSGIGMAIVGMDGRWLTVNSALVETFGYSEAELRKLTFQDLTHPEDYAIGEQALKNLSQDKTRSLQVEKRYIHKS